MATAAAETGKEAQGTTTTKALKLGTQSHTATRPTTTARPTKALGRPLLGQERGRARGEEEEEPEGSRTGTAAARHTSPLGPSATAPRRRERGIRTTSSTRERGTRDPDPAPGLIRTTETEERQGLLWEQQQEEAVAVLGARGLVAQGPRPGGPQAGRAAASIPRPGGAERPGPVREMTLRLRPKIKRKASRRMYGLGCPSPKPLQIRFRVVSYSVVDIYILKRVDTAYFLHKLHY